MRGILGGKVKSIEVARLTPRACGEYVYDGGLAYAELGSPPCMRGIFCKAKDPSIMIRLTPAYAGNI